MRTVRSRRSHLPAPWISVAALVLGVALAAVAALLFRWPWWLSGLVLIAPVSLAALLFAATAFTGGKAAETWSQLTLDVLSSVSQRRARELALRRRVAPFRSAPFPLYGLPPTWPGRRMLGSTSSSADRNGPMRTTALELRHVNGPAVDVEACHVDDDGLTVRLDELGADVDDGGVVTIPVDGQEHEFRYRTSDGGVVAYTHVGDHAILVRCDRSVLDDVELVRITDLQPYIDGRSP
ncbi:hypothetical protein [Haloechinothrix halophila]|uniref:hypothetical protein n=1 Tax=Haloechinothrix halophila TaxID=1069073 RepID=UPI000429C7E3|nr:hypothetical protein [Haloechinothrix halophila]